MKFDPNSSHSANALSFDYAEVHFLGGPWDGGVVALGKQFNVPSQLFPVPLATRNPHEPAYWRVHSGLLAPEVRAPFSHYNFATASEPEIDENKNLKVRFFYIYDQCRRWKVINGGRVDT